MQIESKTMPRKAQKKPMRLKLDPRFEDFVSHCDSLADGAYRARAYIDDLPDHSNMEFIDLESHRRELRFD